MSGLRRILVAVGLFGALAVGLPGVASAAGSDLGVVLGVPAAGTLGVFASPTVTVANAGPDAAPGTVLTVVVPAAFRLSSVVGMDSCALPNADPIGSFTCSLGSLASGATQTLTMNGSWVDSGSAAWSASVATTGTDGVPGNDTAVATTSIPRPLIDLSLTKTAPATATVDGDFTYGFSFNNPGVGSIPNAVFTDQLPVGVNVLVVGLGGGGFASMAGGVTTWFGTLGSCQFPAPSQPPRTLACTLTLPAGYSGMAAYSRASVTGTITNTATVTAAGFDDPVLTNNTSSATTTIPATADLAVTASSPGNAVIGTGFDYTMTVRNNGPDTATSTSLTVTLPPQVAFVSASAGCAGTGPVTCALGTIAAAATSSAVHVSVQAVALGHATASGTADSAEEDQVPANSTGSAMTMITAAPLPPGSDLGVVLGVPAAGTLGVSASATVTVGNDGPDAAPGTVLTVVLPPAFKLSSVAGIASCVPPNGDSGGTITCSLDSFASGASESLAMNGSWVDSGSATWSASVTTTGTDGAPGNNTAVATTSIPRPLIDFSLTKTAPATVTVDGDFTYAFSFNNPGVGSIPNAVFTDQLPVGVNVLGVWIGGGGFASMAGGVTTWIGTRGTCQFPAPSQPPRTLACTLTLPAGYSGMAAYSRASVTGTITNTATVTAASVDDPVLTNNTSSATTTVSVLVPDTTAPVISGVSPGITAEATGPAGAAVAYTSPTALDAVDGAVSVACLPVSGSVFPIATSTVSCSATDAHGNTASASFTVTVQDTLPPVISGMPADITAEASVPLGTMVTFVLPTAALDLADGSLPLACSSPGGAVFFVVGTTTVTCSVTDAHGNMASASFTVTVHGMPPPVIASDLGVVLGVPAVGTLGVAASVSVTVTNAGPDAAPDTVLTVAVPLAFKLSSVAGLFCLLPNVEPITAFTCSLGSLASGASGTVTVNGSWVDSGSAVWSASVTTSGTDAVPGNDSAAATTSIPRPLIDLSLTKTAPSAVLVDGDLGYGFSFDNPSENTLPNVVLTDQLPAGVVVRVVALGRPGMGAFTSGGFTTWYGRLGSCQFPAPSQPPRTLACTLNLPAGGSSFAVYTNSSVSGTITNTATATSASADDPDLTNNTSTATTTVSLPDSVAPVISGVPPGITAEATGPAGAAVTYTSPTALDAVDGPVAVACVPASGSLFPVGVTTVTCSATDAHANTASASFTVTVRVTAPVLPTVSASLVRTGKGGDDESEQSFRVVFSATDPAGIRTLTATLNGVVVANGQVVKLKQTKKGAQKVKREDGKLQIEATSFLLTVIATNTAGGSRTATAAPVFVKNGKDDEGKHGESGHSDH